MLKEIFHDSLKNTNTKNKFINFFEQSKLKLRIVAPSTFSCDTK